MSTVAHKCPFCRRHWFTGESSPWIDCADRLPEPCGVETFSGGNLSVPVLCLFPDDLSMAPAGQMIRPAYYCRWEDHGEWMEAIDGHGGLDRCASHGCDEPTHWMPLPPTPTTERRTAGEGT